MRPTLAPRALHSPGSEFPQDIPTPGSAQAKWCCSYAHIWAIFALPIKEPNNSSTLRLNTERLSGEEADNKMFAAAAFAHVQHKPIGPTHIKLLTTLQYLSHTEANTQSSERTLKTAG